jgi:nitrate/TMAO reductase-like tetraheme cytochrome c subunit
MHLHIGFGVAAIVVCSAVSIAAQAPTKEDCLTCHAERFTPDVLTPSVHGPLQCVDCHADAGKELPHPEKLQQVACATCHSEISGEYEDSVHGRARRDKGLVVAPACSSCHGTHEIRAASDPQSRVHRAAIAANCTKCHEGIQPQYATSIHADQFAKGNTAAATCSDCHTAHRITRTESDAWQLSVIEECGTCHLDRIATYRDTFHGQVTALGSARVATCSDCHGHHTILPASNPVSMVAPQNKVTTCRKCHSNANENFAKYDPHADKHDRERSPQLYWTYRFMKMLLGGVFLFFGVHTLLWFPRSFKARRERRSRAEPQPPETPR